MKMTFDASELQSKLVEPLRGSERRVRAAVAAALTRTAVAVRDAERREMRDVFDRPTPFTLNSLFVQPATADKPEARAGIKDNVAGARSAVSWLRWQIKGGLREQTAFEKLLTRNGAMRGDQRLVPGEFARLDSFGNISRGQLVQILSQLRIESGTGSSRALPRVGKGDNVKEGRYKARVIRRAYGRAGGQYVAFPNGRGRLRPGIYVHGARDFGARVGLGRTGKLKPVLIFVSKAQYEAERFDFAYVAQLTIRRVLPAELSGQLARSLLQASAAPGQRISLA